MSAVASTTSSSALTEFPSIPICRMIERHEEKALRLMKNGEMQPAIRAARFGLYFYKEHHQRFPTRLWQISAIAHKSLNKLDLALSYAIEGLSHTTDPDVTSRLCLIIANIQLKKNSEDSLNVVLKAAEKGLNDLNLDPNVEGLLSFYQAEALRRLKQFPEAIEAADYAKDIHELHPNIQAILYLELATIAHQQGEYMIARDTAQTGLAIPGVNGSHIRDLLLQSKKNAADSIAMPPLLKTYTNLIIA